MNRLLRVKILILLTGSVFLVAPALGQDGYWPDRYVNVYDYLSGAGETPPELSPDGRLLAQMQYRGVAPPAASWLFATLIHPASRKFPVPI